MSAVETLSENVGSVDLTEQSETEPELEIPEWDLRPKGPQGHLESAGGRQKARLRNIEDQGAAASADVPFVGSGTIVSHRQGVIVEENVTACVPIPMKEMTPNDPEASGWVTPFRKV